MKHTALKRKSDDPKAMLKAKTDRDYQDFFRELCFDYDIKSEYSGLPMEVCHHPREKISCAALEFDVRNFVPLTYQEHEQIHNAGNPEIMEVVGGKRGAEWKDALDKVVRDSKADRGIRTIEWYQEKAEDLKTLKENRQELVAMYRCRGYFALGELTREDLPFKCPIK